MSKSRIINIRVTQRQYEMIQLRKEVAGYASLSQFIRSSLLKNSLWLEKMIREIHYATVRK